MILERFPEIRQLPTEELAQLHAELDEILFGPTDDVVTDPATLALLEARRAEYLRDPSTARPAEELLAELRAKYIDGRRE